MLVQRWAMLRTPMPRNLPIRRIIATVVALAKLHNFCIDESNSLENNIPSSLASDDNDMLNNSKGYVGMMEDEAHGETAVPIDLMQPGHHFDDVPRNMRARHMYAISRDTHVLPRTAIHQFIEDGHWVRPRQNKRKVI